MDARPPGPHRVHRNAVALEESTGVPDMSANRQKMNPVVKQLWLEALRSSTYKQGCRVLGRADNFCCLCVLRDVAVQQGIIPAHRGNQIIRAATRAYRRLS